MVILAASSKTLLKAFTAEYVKVGGKRLLIFSSGVEVKEDQSTRLRLVQMQRVRIKGLSLKKDGTVIPFTSLNEKHLQKYLQLFGKCLQINLVNRVK